MEDKPRFEFVEDMITFERFDGYGVGILTYLFFDKETAYCINQQIYYEKYINKDNKM